MANGQQIIEKFELWVDDGTELSAIDELNLLNEVYLQVWTERPWEFAKKAFGGTISGTSIALPSDFGFIVEVLDEESVVYVDGKHYQLVNFSGRKEADGDYCYVDIVNSLLVFSKPVSGTVTYDYSFFPALLTVATEPAFPEQFHSILQHLMASSDYAIQQFDKAKSYAPENAARAEEWLNKMRFWNANLAIN